MKTTRILPVAMLTVAFTLTPALRADNCSASQATSSPAASTAARDLVAVAAGADNFKTLVAAIKAAGLVETLQGKGPFTVFAPTDEAFAKLPPGTVENLLKPENRDKLIAVLKYHVVPGKVTAADVKTMEAKTAQGQPVQIKVTSDGVMVDNARVVKTDILADNGVIHVIDSVILPKS
ncbi:MAG: fasciclin domain-containing protein [Verrucomicrobiae bacterium]|nr:fasciclin domain-containing protein [Verrucomicrobiae bacterium]